MMRHTFPKTEHLTSRKIIDRLFARPRPGTPPPSVPAPEGSPQTFHQYPFRVLYFRAEPGTESLLPLPQVLFSVPKRTFKKAVDRNAVRRRAKEAYRLHKHGLLPPNEALPAGGERQLKRPVVQLVFLYTAKAKISFEEIEKGMKLALKKMV